MEQPSWQIAKVTKRIRKSAKKTNFFLRQIRNTSKNLFIENTLNRHAELAIWIFSVKKIQPRCFLVNFTKLLKVSKYFLPSQMNLRFTTHTNINSLKLKLVKTFP